MNKGKLYIVATPIGNLKDITLRALEVLENVDIIACEDTRQTIKLLNHYSISKKLVSYHEYSEKEKAESLIDKIENGSNIAFVSDAGTPAISDPGRMLVKIARERNIEIAGIPGPCAGINAFSIAGLEEKKFLFYGFLSDKASERKDALNEIKQFCYPSVLYVSPHKISKTLEDIKNVCGADTKIQIFREMTKIHEEYLSGTPNELLNHFSESEPKGEFVFVIIPVKEERKYTDDELLSLLNELIKNGYSRKDASKEVSRITGVSKNRLYALIV